jgi:hypothetical protein
MYHTPKLDRFSQCLLIPGRVADARGFIVGDGVIQGMKGDITPAISIEAIRNAAVKYEQVGLVDRAVLDEVKAELAGALAQAAVLRAELDRLEAVQEHISGLRKAGFQVSKVKGRPAAKQEANA